MAWLCFEMVRQLGLHRDHAVDPLYQQVWKQALIQLDPWAALAMEAVDLDLMQFQLSYMICHSPIPTDWMGPLDHRERAPHMGLNTRDSHLRRQRHLK